MNQAAQRSSERQAAAAARGAVLERAQQDAARRAQTHLPELVKAIAALVAGPSRAEAEAMVASPPPPSGPHDDRLRFYLDRSMGTGVSPSIRIVTGTVRHQQPPSRGWRTKPPPDLVTWVHTGWEIRANVCMYPLYRRASTGDVYIPTDEHVYSASLEIGIDLSGTASTGFGSLTEVAQRGIVRWTTSGSSSSDQLHVVDVGAAFEYSIRTIAAYLNR